ncbi:MAG TPA: sterol desaturase family protein [Chitinophagales bacterium]|nr:sterol desaturase family protein [Chitinophagales bacterium]
MEKYGQALLIAIPCFLVLILIEIIYGAIIRKDQLNNMDIISSLSSGMTNILKDTLGLTIVVISYPFLLSKIAIFHGDKHPVLMAILAFVIMDFGGYWYHRFTHTINYFWNLHIVHHSSEEYNLPCALRQQFSVFTNLPNIFFQGILMAVFGVPFEIYAIIAPVHLFLQFWYHTRYIDKMGFLEYVLVTPSHHRVHHAMNDIYMDKNFSQIFIIWDKLFGTFQVELDEIPPVYGVRRPVRTWNPFLINLRHLWLLITDTVRTKSIKDKIAVWFMPTGWRPADVTEKYPVFYIKNMNELQKYNPVYSTAFKVWSNIQLVFVFFLLIYLFTQFGKLPMNLVMQNGLFILLSIFAFTSLMDKSSIGLMAEWLRFLIGAYIIVSTGDWFGINAYISSGSWFILGYLLIAAIVSSYFYFKEFKPENKTALAV